MATYDDKLFSGTISKEELGLRPKPEPSKPLGLTESDIKFGLQRQGTEEQRSQAAAGMGGTNGGGDGAMNAPKSLGEVLNKPRWNPESNPYSPRIAPPMPSLNTRINEYQSRQPIQQATMTPEQLNRINQPGPATSRLGAFDSQGNPIKSRGSTFSVVGNNNSGLSPRQQMINNLMGRLKAGTLTGASGAALQKLLDKDLSARTDATTARINANADQAATLMDNAFKADKLAQEQSLAYQQLASLDAYRQAQEKRKGTENILGLQKDIVSGNISLGDMLKSVQDPNKTIAQTILDAQAQSLGLGNLGLLGMSEEEKKAYLEKQAK